jgi:hypothetical protein
MAALGVNVFDATIRTRVEALQWTVAKDLLTAGATVVLEWGTWARADRDELREQVRALGASVQLRFLDVPTGEQHVLDPPVDGEPEGEPDTVVAAGLRERVGCPGGVRAGQQPWAGSGPVAVGGSGPGVGEQLRQGHGQHGDRVGRELDPALPGRSNPASGARHHWG